MHSNTKDIRRRQLYRLLGDLPPRRRRIGVRLSSREERDGYRVERLTLDLNGLEPVPALFVCPKEGGPFPTILYNHWHGGDYHRGKMELLEGHSGLQRPPYAEELTRRGYAALAIDSWAFGERRGRTESAIFKEMLWRGRVMWGMMVYDALRAVDYLMTRSDVDADRIGALGISMGSTTAWWTAALHPQVGACVDICCLTEYEELIRTGGIDGHGIYYYVPGLLKHFTAAQINALISPRPHLCVAGRYDRLTPPEGLARIEAELKQVYRRDGASNAFEMHVYDCGHLETADMRARILAFLEKWLHR